MELVVPNSYAHFGQSNGTVVCLCVQTKPTGETLTELAAPLGAREETEMNRTERSAHEQRFVIVSWRDEALAHFRKLTFGDELPVRLYDQYFSHKILTELKDFDLTDKDRRLVEKILAARGVAAFHCYRYDMTLHFGEAYPVTEVLLPVVDILAGYFSWQYPVRGSTEGGLATWDAMDLAGLPCIHPSGTAYNFVYDGPPAVAP